MTDAAIRCTTHHAACDCREAATRAEVERLTAERDQARRAALEEAIAVCEERATHNRSLAVTLLRDHLTSRAEGADECIGDLRALIDTPAPETA